MESYDQSSSRYFVQLSGEGDVIKIKFDNLLQNCRCEVTGMVNRAELNGKSATLVRYDEEKGRIHADIQGVGRASLQKGESDFVGRMPREGLRLTSDSAPSE